MTRWAMVADLRRCVGCQTCTASCKVTNATPVGVQWRRVLDMEIGEYPDVQRAFVPVGCQHCDEPPCVASCPTTATRKRADGVVTMDYDLCIGCAYCAVSCPYQARYRTLRASFAYGEPIESEKQTHRAERLAVATKCTFCVDRIDDGMARGLKPGVDPEATPACVNACIARAMTFGDLDDPQSNVSRILAENQHFRMHEELGTGPGFFYLWDREAADPSPPLPPPLEGEGKRSAPAGAGEGRGPPLAPPLGGEGKWSAPAAAGEGQGPPLAPAPGSSPGQALEGDGKRSALREGQA